MFDIYHHYRNPALASSVEQPGFVFLNRGQNANVELIHVRVVRSPVVPSNPHHVERQRRSCSLLAGAYQGRGDIAEYTFWRSTDDTSR